MGDVGLSSVPAFSIYGNKTALSLGSSGLVAFVSDGVLCVLLKPAMKHVLNHCFSLHGAYLPGGVSKVRSVAAVKLLHLTWTHSTHACACPALGPLGAQALSWVLSIPWAPWLWKRRAISPPSLRWGSEPAGQTLPVQLLHSKSPLHAHRVCECASGWPWV